jgi:hypothetical protein
MNELYNSYGVRVHSWQKSRRKAYAICNCRHCANHMKATHYSQVEKARLTKVFVRKYPDVYYVENGTTDSNKR